MRRARSTRRRSRRRRRRSRSRPAGRSGARSDDGARRGDGDASCLSRLARLGIDRLGDPRKEGVVSGLPLDEDVGEMDLGDAESLGDPPLADSCLGDPRSERGRRKAVRSVHGISGERHTFVCVGAYFTRRYMRVSTTEIGGAENHGSGTNVRCRPCRTTRRRRRSRPRAWLPSSTSRSSRSTGRPASRDRDRRRDRADVHLPALVREPWTLIARGPRPRIPSLAGSASRSRAGPTSRRRRPDRPADRDGETAPTGEETPVGAGVDMRARAGQA